MRRVLYALTVAVLASIGMFAQTGEIRKIPGRVDATDGYFSGSVVVGSSTTMPTSAPAGTLYARNVGANTHGAVLFGDSMTDNNGGGPTNIGPSTFGYFDWANALLGQPWNLVKNAGIGGNTTAQMLARISTDVYPYCANAGWIFVMGGVNDVEAGVSAADIISNLKAIYTGVRANCGGINFVALTVTSRTTFTTAPKHQAWSDTNEWIKQYFRDKPNAYVVDTGGSYVDPTNANAVPLAVYVRDTVHPSANGGWVMGKAIADVLKSVAPPPAVLPTWAGDKSNKIANPFLTGEAGALNGFSGKIPTSWIGAMSGDTPTCASAVTSRADGFGQTMTVSITGAATTSFCKIAQTISAVTLGSNNDTFRFTVEVTTTTTPSIQARCDIAWPYLYAWMPSVDNAWTEFSPAVTGLTFRSYPVVVPSGASVICSLSVYGTTGQATFGRVALQKVVQ